MSRYLVCETCFRGVQDGEDVRFWMVDALGRATCPLCLATARLHAAVVARLRRDRHGRGR